MVSITFLLTISIPMAKLTCPTLGISHGLSYKILRYGRSHSAKGGTESPFCKLSAQ
jgi:hypothetical protein